MKPSTISGGASDGPRYGGFGGAFVPETLVPAVQELEVAYDEAKADRSFALDLRRLLGEYAGRPTPLTAARRLSAALGGARIYLKREDLAHTRSTMPWVKRCWHAGWGSGASWQKLELGSMGSRQRLYVRCWDWSASCTWGRWIWPASA